MRVQVTDVTGHPIYLTDERWQHICDEHPEMEPYEEKILETLRLGRRFEGSIRPDVFPYYRAYADLPYVNTTIVVVVRFGFLADGSPNSFVLTAYQMFRMRS